MRIQRGDVSLRWEDLVQLSTQGDRHEKIPLKIEAIQKLGSLDGEAEAFLRAVKSALAKSTNKDINIFVHGAMSSFYKGCAETTQLYHFMAQQGVFVTFSWPSTGKIVTYSKDRKYAAESVPHF